MHTQAVAEFKAVARHRAVVAEFETAKQGSRRASTESERGQPAPSSSKAAVRDFMCSPWAAVSVASASVDDAASCWARQLWLQAGMKQRDKWTRQDHLKLQCLGGVFAPCSHESQCNAPAGWPDRDRSCRSRPDGEAPQLPGALHDGARPRRCCGGREGGAPFLSTAWNRCPMECIAEVSARQMYRQYRWCA